MTARIAERRGHPPQSLAAAYGNGELLQWLLKRDITPYMHARDNALARTTRSTARSTPPIPSRATAISARQANC
jgi:hypothetical protein